MKFKSEINSIPLREYKRTFDIDLKNKKIKLAGIKFKWLKVNGLEQIPENAEIANAVLVRKCRDYYLHITTFTDKEPIIIPERSIGIDFGCETQLTLSNGIKIQFQVPVTKKIKKLDRKISRKINSKKKETI